MKTVAAPTAQNGADGAPTMPAYDARLVLRAGDDPITVAAAQRLADKHPGTVLAVLDGDTPKVLQGDAASLTGVTKVQVVGHADGSAAAMGGRAPSQLAEAINVLAPTAGVAKVALVGCGSHACSLELGQKLSENQPGVNVKGYDGPMKVLDNGRKQPTSADDPRALGPVATAGSPAIEKGVIDGDQFISSLREVMALPDDIAAPKANDLYRILAGTPEITFSIKKDAVTSITGLQHALEYDAFERLVDHDLFTADERNLYAETARALVGMSLPESPERDYTLSLQKPQLATNPKLVGYEIEMGAYFKGADLPPHFILAETAAKGQLGWPILSLQIDRMPGRSPQIEVVTAPLTRSERTGGDYSTAINALKESVLQSDDLSKLLAEYNPRVSEGYKLHLADESERAIASGTNFSYELAFPGNSKLVTSNVQTTVQFPYTALAGGQPGLDHLFSSDIQLQLLLLQSRNKAAERLRQVGADPAANPAAHAVLVHHFFENAANILAGRAGSFDFKVKAPFIVRTKPETMAAYINNHSERTVLRKALKYADSGEDILSILSDNMTPKSRQISEQTIRTVSSFQNAQILDALNQAEQVGPFLSTHGGYVLGSQSGAPHLLMRPSMDQTRNLAPVLCGGTLHCAIELRNWPGFSAFHRGHAGIAQNAKVSGAVDATRGTKEAPEKAESGTVKRRGGKRKAAQQE